MPTGGLLSVGVLFVGLGTGLEPTQQRQIPADCSHVVKAA